MAVNERNSDLLALEIAVNQQIHAIFEAMRANDPDTARMLWMELNDYIMDEFNYQHERYGRVEEERPRALAMGHTFYDWSDLVSGSAAAEASPEGSSTG
jgi:hypothetical protein